MIRVLLLLLLPFGSSKAQPADYPLNAEVQSASLVNICGASEKGSDCGYVQHLTILIDGKRYQVNGTSYSSDILATGVYKAKIQKDDTHGSSYLYTRIYRLLFPDGKTADYFVIGEGQ